MGIWGRGIVTADVLMRELDCGAFATGGYEEEEHHTEREARFIQLRAPGNSIR